MGFFPFPRENLIKIASFGRKAEQVRFPARWPQPRLPGCIDLGFASPRQVWTRGAIGPHLHHRSRLLPFPRAANSGSHVCAYSVGLAGWGFFVVGFFFSSSLTNDFKLSRGKRSPLLFLTVVKLSFFVNPVSSVAGRNRPALVRLCAFFVPRVPELCSGRLAAPGEDIGASVRSSRGLARPGSAPRRLPLPRVRAPPR